MRRNFLFRSKSFLRVSGYFRASNCPLKFRKDSRGRSQGAGRSRGDGRGSSSCPSVRFSLEPSNTSWDLLIGRKRKQRFATVCQSILFHFLRISEEVWLLKHADGVGEAQRRISSISPASWLESKHLERLRSPVQTLKVRVKIPNPCDGENMKHTRQKRTKNNSGAEKMQIPPKN